jgi:hypothetical protein
VTGQDDAAAPERRAVPTDDGHYFVIDGRRWKATDPRIPETLKKELVAELMSARRAVRTDPASARPRVQDAKVALGERGEPWWEPPSADGARIRLAATMRALLRHRAPESTICPSDAARVAGGDDWRSLMDTARDIAADLVADGTLRATQQGETVDPRTATGPIRLGRGPGW